MGRSRSRILLPFVLLALETGARFNTIRTLQWKNITFGNRSLQLGKDKTTAGTGRVVPLNQRALAALTFWAREFPNRISNNTESTSSGKITPPLRHCQENLHAVCIQFELLA